METRIFATVFITLSLVFLLVMVPGLLAGSAANPMFQASGVGPAAIPYFAGGAVLVLSVAILIEDLRNSEPDAPAEGPGRGEARNVALAIAFLLGFLVAMPFLGFLLAGILFLAAFFLFFRPKPLLTAVIVAVAAPVAIDLLLREVFLIPLPRFLGF
jgi:putative tricarboxylic transport membrane protein